MKSKFSTLLFTVGVLGTSSLLLGGSLAGTAESMPSLEVSKSAKTMLPTQIVEEVSRGSTRAALDILVVDENLSKPEALRMVRRVSEALAHGSVTGNPPVDTAADPQLAETDAVLAAIAAKMGNYAGTVDTLLGYKGLTRAELFEAVELGVLVGSRRGANELGISTWLMTTVVTTPSLLTQPNIS
jgi:hypothetical protein